MITTYSATTVKNEFGRVLDTALAAGEIAIEKHKRIIGHLVSHSRYEALRALEDEVLALRAQLAEARGDFLTEEETEAWLMKK